MVGLLEDVQRALPTTFSEPGTVVALFGRRATSRGERVLAHVSEGMRGLPVLDLVSIRALWRSFVELARTASCLGARRGGGGPRRGRGEACFAADDARRGAERAYRSPPLVGLLFSQSAAALVSFEGGREVTVLSAARGTASHALLGA